MVLYARATAATSSCSCCAPQVLDQAKAAGLTVIRTWAFCDGAEWNALQPAPGEWDERVFAALDWLLAEAAARGLRVVLALSNYWAAYGGVKQYVRRAAPHAQCSLMHLHMQYLDLSMSEVQVACGRLGCRWSCERRGVEVTDRAEDFYEDPYCQARCTWCP